MRELLVLSGKGGTGKTSIMASFAALCGDAVLVDCDVDAANLHLVVHCEKGAANEFIASRKAEIDTSRCSGCGKCGAACRFQAVDGYTVDRMSCEGCGLCVRVCPEGAIKMVDCVSGHWFHSMTPYGPLMHARLLAGEGNSGKLVSALRDRARQVAESAGKGMIILDGPPGIGCPVLASMAGVSLVVLVTEPTVSGLHDFGRILKVCKDFNVRTVACINRFDLDEGISKKIEARCCKKGTPVVGRVPVDRDVIEAIVHGM
ncbi:MAG: ATP-binding protein, partial [Bacillota bacterium]